MVNGGLRAACESIGRFSVRSDDEKPGIHHANKERKNDRLAAAARFYRAAIRSNSSSTAARRAGGSGLSDSAKPKNVQ
jgi:hypothetical protein